MEGYVTLSLHATKSATMQNGLTMAHCPGTNCHFQDISLSGRSISTLASAAHIWLGRQPFRSTEPLGMDLRALCTSSYRKLKLLMGTNACQTHVQR